MMNGWQDFDRLLGSMDLLRTRMNRMFNDLDSSWLAMPGVAGGNFPRTNLYEEAEHFELRAEVPGFAKEEINIRLQGNYLELTGKRGSDAPKGYNVHRRERQAATFSRSFTLPADIDPDKVEAHLKDGILTLKLPKAEAAKPRQIAIS